MDFIKECFTDTWLILLFFGLLIIRIKLDKGNCND